MNSKTLIIVESPNKIKKIQKYVGDEYKVTASVGHISDLVIGRGWRGLGIKDEINFEGIYVVNKDKKQIVSGLLRDVAISKEVLLAMDPDREGEAIAWHLKRELKLINPKRIVFHEISKKAILNAIANKTDIDIDMFKAQETRRIIDRIMGFELSKCITLWNNELKSAGRVQSAGLKMIAERDEKIKSFKPTTFNFVSFKSGELTYQLKSIDGEAVERDQLTKLMADEILKATQNIDDVKISRVLSEEKKCKTRATINDKWCTSFRGKVRV